MKVLLSPAKAIDMDRTLAAKATSTPLFLSEAESLVKKLSKFSASKIGKMMSLSKELSELNYQRFQSWEPTTTLNGHNSTAGAMFNGEVYRGLDATTMTAAQLAVAQDKIRILSGLYGILKPLDVIAPYRLEMGTRWAVTPAKKNLYKFWGTKIAEALNAENEDGVVINLASSEYFKAVDVKALKGNVITCQFKEFKNGEYKMLMVYVKQARGMMARYIVDQDISDPEELKLFDRDGYSFNVNMSSESEWVFTR